MNDAKSDQYLLGLIAYEMIAGAPPVRVANWASALDPAIADAMLHPRPLKDFVEPCEEAVSDIVMRMLAVDPDARWDSLETVKRKLEETLPKKSCVEEAKESYRRCARDLQFYQTLYEKLFAVMPEIRGMFIKRSMEEQYQVLRDALWLLLTYADTREQGEPTVLGAIARTHAQYEPRQFDTFRDAVLDAVAKHDPRGSTAVDAWRDAITPGLDYLKSKAGSAAHSL